MCGKTPAEDHVKVVLDHKVPRQWGGKTEFSNLEPLCEDCNLGKKAYFSSFVDSEMKQVVALRSVHERLARIFMIKKGEPLASRFLRAIANYGSVQDDWHKRLRELRYVGMHLKLTKKRVPEGYTESFYTLTNDVTLPPNLSRWIARYESDRAQKNRAQSRKT